ncbi:hypothetical protein NDU88_005874 [Pleurodeles waltl]|uniref:Uncharacterized protein n=1 Tax=Pleurodeles waltl TaxID=8319 RepID=A0AAV7RQC4_PLEWA|nr:hypothetical protein NDU88_005874 [Pleurodeles waltl]
MGITLPEALEYIEQINIPSIDPSQKHEVKSDLTLEAIKLAIMHIARGKTPGTIGFPIDLYSMYQAQLAPRTLKVYETAVRKGVLSYSRREALIVVSPKPGRDPLQLTSYHPLSLFNLDDKVLDKVLTNPLSSLIDINWLTRFQSLDLIISKRCIAMYWKSRMQPPLRCWRTNIVKWFYTTL